jgi:hypothetical protein
MLLSVQLLVDVADVNRFRTVSQLESRAGSTIDVYMRLVDREADKDYNPPGRRFVPAPYSTLVASLKSAYPRKQLAFPCSTPFPDDRSIWHFQIQPNDGKLAPAPGGGPIIDYSNLIPLGEPFDFNVSVTDFGMVGTFGITLTLTENPGWHASGTLAGVVAGDEVVINGVLFVAVAAGATGTQFDVGVTDGITASNLASVINTNSAIAQVTAIASGTTLSIVAIRVASIVWSSASGHFTLGTPSMSGNARITTGWAPAAISIAPSFPGI